MISGIRFLRRNVISNAFGTVVPAVAWVLIVPVLVRHLGEQGYGVYTVAISFAGVLGFLELGLTSAATKYIAEIGTRNNIEKLQKVISSNLSLYIGLGGGITLLFSVVAPFIAPFVFRNSGIDLRELSLLIRLVGVLLALTLLRDALSSVPRGLQRYDIYNSIQVGYAVGLAVTQGTIVILGGQVIALMLGNIAVTMASMVGFVLVIRRLMPTVHLVRLPDRATLRVLFAFGVYMLLINVTATFLFNIDKVIVGWALGPASVTYYAVPTQIALKIHNGLGVFVSFLFPLASEVQSAGDQAALSKIYLHSMRFVMLIDGLAMVFLGTFAREITAMWIGPEFAAISAPILVPISFGYLLFALSIVPYQILIGIGHPREMGLLNVAATLCVILCLLGGISSLGLVGSGLGTMIGMIAMVVFPWYVQRLLRIPWRTAFRDSYGRTLLCCACGLAVGTLLSRCIAARLAFYPIFVAAVLVWGNTEREDWRRIGAVCRQVVASVWTLARPLS